MKRNLDKVQGWIGLSEGGLVDHPRDPGGLTDRGITQRTFNGWLRSQGKPIRSVRGISKADAETIIHTQYMAPVWFDKLPSGLDYAMADYAVNSGPSRAVKEIQRIVGTKADGVMGNQTFGEIIKADTEGLIKQLCQKRMSFLRRLKTFDAFGRGWTTRVMGHSDGFQANDIGVIDRAIMLLRNDDNIPAPTVVAAGKARPQDVSNSTIVEKLIKDPIAAVPVIGAVAPVLNGAGPIQIALSVVLVIMAGYFVFSRIKREQQND